MFSRRAAVDTKPVDVSNLVTSGNWQKRMSRTEAIGIARIGTAEGCSLKGDQHTIEIPLHFFAAFVCLFAVPRDAQTKKKFDLSIGGYISQRVVVATGSSSNLSCDFFIKYYCHYYLVPSSFAVVLLFLLLAPTVVVPRRPLQIPCCSDDCYQWLVVDVVDPYLYLWW